MSQTQRRRPQAAIAPVSAYTRPRWLRSTAGGMATLLLCQAMLPVASAYAQIAPRAQAQAGQRPFIDAARNGVPIAHIAPPSAGGVSRNQYDRFNVNPNGLILNNSAVPTQTQQGGWISGNPQLGPIPARIVLNEVLGADASQLRGTIEVAGQRADIVVANPNGIHCDGCGFLNAGRASLVTGLPLFGGDGLGGFDVRGGQLSVGGNGLNASNLEQLDLIARGLVIEGEVWATNLKAIAGANRVLYASLQAAAQQGAGPAPRFAIDIRDLGGMYANQVYLVSSELGAGVNSSGRIAALQGNLVLSAHGDLMLKDSYARQAMRIESTGNIQLAGQTRSEAAMSIRSGAALGNTGAIDADGGMEIAAGSIANAGAIVQRNADGAQLNATGRFDNSGGIQSGGALNIVAADMVDNKGSLQSSGALRLDADSLALSGTGIVSGGDVAIVAARGDITARNTVIRTQGKLLAHAAGAADAAASDWQALGRLDLSATSVSSRGAWLQANGDVHLGAAGAIDNGAGQLLAGGRLALDAGTVSNVGGLVASNADVIVRADAGIDNRAGTISAATRLDMRALNGGLDNTAGTLVAGDGVGIVSGRLSNDGATIAALSAQGGALDIRAASVSNRRGAISAGGALALLSAGEVNNSGGAIEAGAAATISAGAASLVNEGARIVARDALAISAGVVRNDAAGAARGIIASSQGATQIDAGRTSNLGGLINAATRLGVSGGALDNGGGEASGGASVNIDTHGGALRNQGGALLSGGDLDIRAGAIDSGAAAAAATIAAAGKLDVAAKSLDITGSQLVAQRKATLALGDGVLSARGGAIEAGDTLSIAAGAVDARGARVLAGNAASITAASVDASDGTISAANTVSIKSAGALDNARGSITSNGSIDIAASRLGNAGGVVSALRKADVRIGAGVLDNAGGRLIGGETLSLQSGEIRNAGGTISTASALSLDTQGQALDNHGGLIVAGGALTIRSKGMDNRAGVAAALGGTLDVDSAGALLDNDGGRLQAQGAVLLNSGDMRNRGGLVSGNRVRSDGAALDNRGGAILSTGRMDLGSAALSNDGGLLQALGELVVDTHGAALTNTGSGATGGILAGGSLDIAAGSLDNRAGFIASNDKQNLIVAAGIDNRGGAIAANGKLTLHAGVLDNRAADNAAGAIDGAHVVVNADTVDNRGGAIRSAGGLGIAAATLDNREGNLGAAGDLTANAKVLVNDAGRIVGDASVTVTTASRAPGGTIASRKDVTMNILGDYDNAGLLSAGRNLNINAANVVNTGTLTAGNTLTMHAGNVDNAGEISAPTLDIRAAGKLSNAATGLIDGVDSMIRAAIIDNVGRIYGDRLGLHADAIDNHGSGVIAARDTLTIGASKLANRDGGLIYSLGDIRIGGRIDADGRLQGAAQSVLNASSRIEAARALSIASASILNRNDGLTTRTVFEAPVHREFVQPRESATRFPIAQCDGIGGRQDNNYCIVHPELYGRRSALKPVFQNFEFLGLDLPGEHTLENANYAWNSPVFAQFGVASVAAPPKEPAGGCTGIDSDGAAFSVNTPACSVWRSSTQAWNNDFVAALNALDAKVNAYNAVVNEENLRLKFEDYTWYRIDSTTSHTEIATTAPAQLLSGASMQLTGEVNNIDSHIVAGGALGIDGPAVRNVATMGEKRTEYSGTTEFTEIVSCGFGGKSHCREWHFANPYNQAPQVETQALPTVRFEQYAGNPASARDLGVAASAADGSVADAARNGAAAARGIREPSTMAALGSAAPARSVATAPPLVRRVAVGASGAQPAGVILAASPALAIPANRLFELHAEPAARYLVEADPRFTNYRSFLSSDYFLQSLQRDPQYQLKRYGDGFVEQQLVNDQILALTGRRYLDGYASTEAEYIALMNAGIAYARQYGFAPGVSLSPEQMALLTTDIVWLEARTVALPDGGVAQVLAPQVYLRRAQDGDLQPDGALIAGRDVLIQTAQDLVNSGAIAGDSVTASAGRDLVNEGGRIGAQQVWMRASNDLKNLSGAIVGVGADSEVGLLAGRDIVLRAQTRDTVSADGNSSRSSVQHVATVQGGDIRLDAGRDLLAAGAKIDAGGSLVGTAGRDITVDVVAGAYQLNVKDRSGMSTQGRTGYISEAATTNQASGISSGADIALVAGRDLEMRGATIDAGSAGKGALLLQGRNVSIDAAKDRNAVDVQTIGKRSYNRVARDDETLVGAQVAAGADLSIRATGSAAEGAGNIALSGANLTTRQGQATLSANRDILVDAATTQHRAIDESYAKSSNAFSSVATTRSSNRQASLAEGSSLTGNTILAQAGRELTVRGSAVAADEDVLLAAAGKVDIVAALSTSSAQTYSRVEEKGFLSGGSGISYGKRVTTTTGEQNETTQSGQERSLVGSTKGNLSIIAGEALKVSGSDLGAGGDIALLGKAVTIDTGRDTENSRQVTKMQQDSLNLSVGGTVVEAIQTMQSMSDAAGKTKNKRVQALAAATAALATANAAANIAANGANVSISITAGHSESEQTQTHSASTTSGSTVAAGNNLTMVATGAGKDSSINIAGSDVSASRQATLMADNAINIVSTQDLEEQHSKSRSMSAAAGVGISVGTNGVAFGATASASMGRAQEDGSGVTQRNSHVTAGDTLTLISGGDVNVQGAVATGQRIAANVGGDLNIASRQDTARFDSKSQNVSASATVGYGASVSASYNQGSVHNDYASVQEQSGLKAGDGGFDVKVKGNTDLKGGVISSTQAAVEAGANRLTTGTLTQGDVRNHMDSSADSIGISGGIGIAGGDKDDPDKGAGKGPGGVNLVNAAGGTGAKVGMPIATSAGDSSGSVTKSGVSGGAIVITNDAAQQQKTGKGATGTIAGVNRDVATGKDGSGRLKNDFDKEALQAQTTITAAFIQQAAPLAASVVGGIGKAQQDSAQQEAQAYRQAAEAARSAGDATGAAAYEAQAKQAQATADNWSDNGVYRIGLHAAAQAAIGGAAGGAGGALTGAGGVVGGNLGQQLGQKLGEEAAAAQGLEGREKTSLVNSYQQAFATLGGALGGAAAGGASGANAVVAGVQGAGTGYAVDVFNRQLHPDEAKWIKDNAKRYAQQKGVSEASAEQQLAQQAYRQVQAGAAGAWDADASAFLNQAKGMLAQDPNCPSCGPGYMFYATPEQKANPNLYADQLPKTAEFYKKNGLQIPTQQQVTTSTQRDSQIRDGVKTGTLLAPVAAASVAVAGLGSTLASWVLTNPEAATRAGIISADVAAQIASGAVTPTTIAESAAVKAEAKAIPGIDKSFRTANALYPPNAAVIEKMNSLRICSGTDCSEIARVLQATAGEGRILRVTGQSGSDLRLMEYGKIDSGFKYHEVFTDGKYVYDPRLSNSAVPLGDWTKMIQRLNPGAVIK